MHHIEDMMKKCNHLIQKSNLSTTCAEQRCKSHVEDKRQHGVCKNQTVTEVRLKTSRSARIINISPSIQVPVVVETCCVFDSILTDRRNPNINVDCHDLVFFPLVPFHIFKTAPRSMKSFSIVLITNLYFKSNYVAECVC